MSSNWNTTSLFPPNRNAAVELRITMEAFGTEHKNQIIQALKDKGYSPKVVQAVI